MIGIAVGQTITGSATPLVTLRSRNDKPDWDGIAALVRGSGNPRHSSWGCPSRWTTRRSSGPLRSIGSGARSKDAPPRGASHRRAPDLDRGATAARGDAERDAVDAVAAALILETWLCEHGAA